MNQDEDKKIHKIHNQDFDTIRDWLVKRNQTFEDPYFKMDDTDEWLRPSQITKDPQLYVDGTSPYEANKSKTDSKTDCWLTAALRCLGMHPSLMRKVIPPGQSFSKNYAGIFHFHIWRFGRWYDVVIDDRLPTRNGSLVWTKSTSRNGFWAALLEKAYNKVVAGEYKPDGGYSYEALEDFTGGILESFNLHDDPIDFERLLYKAFARCSIMCCDSSGVKQNSAVNNNLVLNYAYTVTGLNRLNISEYGNVFLIRIRNVWGLFDWKGPWSDGSREWEKVPQNIKSDLRPVNQKDGEFWMSLPDLKSQFHRLQICYLSPGVFKDAYGDREKLCTWQINMARGNWVRGVTDGGSSNFSKNPQKMLKLSEADAGNNDGLCSVLIALVQQSTVRNYTIGFRVYRLTGTDHNQLGLDNSFFQNNQPVATSPLQPKCKVVGRFNIAPGAYCIIPFTRDSGSEREFILRTYTENKAEISDLDSSFRGVSSPKLSISPENAGLMEGKTVLLKTDDEVDVKSIEFFNKVSGADQEVDWKELKDVLDFAAKNNIKLTDKKRDDLGHFLLDTASYIYNKIFGPSRKVNAFETIGKKGFPREVCRSMLALLDEDHSGKLGYNEFHSLWQEIAKWKSVYELHSDPTTGYLDSSGFKECLEAAGYKISQRLLCNLIKRYSTKDGKLSFDDFLHCTFKIDAMAQFFNSKDKNGSGKADFTLEELMKITLYS